MVDVTKVVLVWVATAVRRSDRDGKDFGAALGRAGQRASFSLQNSIKDLLEAEEFNYCKVDLFFYFEFRIPKSFSKFDVNLAIPYSTVWF